MPTATAPARALHHRMISEVYVRGYEPGFWLWDGARWSAAALLARHWRPGSQPLLQLRVREGGHATRRLYRAGQPGILPAHPGSRDRRMTWRDMSR